MSGNENVAAGVMAAANNDGILLPQFLTPFANDSSRPAPTFVRSEAAGKN